MAAPEQPERDSCRGAGPTPSRIYTYRKILSPNKLLLNPNLECESKSRIACPDSRARRTDGLVGYRKVGLTIIVDKRNTSL